jgi:alpha-L-rhamnosidase
MKILDKVLAGVLMMGSVWAGEGQVARSEGFPGALTASWIWKRDGEVKGYNQTIVAVRQFEVDRPVEAVARVTADSYYRLYINGVWVNDGPARNWPEHYQYDQLEVGSYLVAGKNEVKIIARYYGVGDFHRVPQQAGLLAQLDVKTAQGKVVKIGTDDSWEVASANAWVANTFKWNRRSGTTRGSRV